MGEAHTNGAAANGAAPSTGVVARTGAVDPGEADVLLTMLRQLTDSDAGIAFIYQALQQLATRYQLQDAAVAVNAGSLSTQIFRLGRRPLEARGAALLFQAGPGVYAEPAVVPPGIRAGVEDLCRLALSVHLARHGSARDLLTGLPSRRVFNESLRSVAAQSSRYGWHFTLLVASIGTTSPSGASDAAPSEFVVSRSGRALGRALRTGDLGTRVTGSTFAAILPNAGADAVNALLERLHSELPSLSAAGISLGSASAPSESVDPVELFRLASTRLREHRQVRR